MPPPVDPRPPRLADFGAGNDDADFASPWCFPRLVRGLLPGRKAIIIWFLWMRALRFTGNLNGIDSVGMEKAVALRRLGRCGLLGSGVGGGLSDRGIDWFCEFRRCCLAGLYQGFIYRLDRPNRWGPVPVYRSGLVGNRSVPVEFKFEFKFRSTTGSYRYTGRFDRFTGRFDW